MIRTMIVDDEYLVRQGLIHILPWEKYELQIIGEADNGQTALEFLKSHEIDLLITDLTMPVMNGFELLQNVRTEYPHLPVVVLTCHQDFQYVQDALRFGALDYMVKTQLEKERVEEVLSRITDRLKQMQDVKLKQQEPTIRQEINWGMLLISNQDQVDIDQLLAAEWTDAGIFQVDPASWFLPRRNVNDYTKDARKLRDMMDEHRWNIVIVHEIDRYDASALTSRLAAYIANEWLYDREPHKHLYYLSYRKVSTKHQTPAAKEERSEWTAQWHRFAWVFDGAEWRELADRIRGSRPAYTEVKRLVLDTAAAWELMLPIEGKSRWFQELQKASCWFELTDIIEEIRKYLILSSASYHLSKEVSMSILQAIDLMRRELHNGINQEVVAQRVHISRGYFSKCFKDMVGIPFNELMKEFRIQKAMELLEQSYTPVYRIAEHVGFQDERYFSKIFRDKVGMLPSEFRIARMENSAASH